jgi:hypothetical protein
MAWRKQWLAHAVFVTLIEIHCQMGRKIQYQIGSEYLQAPLSSTSLYWY